MKLIHVVAGGIVGWIERNVFLLLILLGCWLVFEINTWLEREYPTKMKLLLHEDITRIGIN